MLGTVAACMYLLYISAGSFFYFSFGKRFLVKTLGTYMHTCMHTYIHAYIHTCLHTYIHTYMHTYIGMRSLPPHACLDIAVMASSHASCWIIEVWQSTPHRELATATTKKKKGTASQ